MDTDPQEKAKKGQVTEHKVIDPKRVEKELKFVLHCLVSSISNGGKVDFKVLGKEFNITAKGAGDKLWRLEHRYGLTKNQRAEKAKKEKAMRSNEDKDDFGKVEEKGNKLKQEIKGEKRESDGEEFEKVYSEYKA